MLTPILAFAPAAFGNAEPPQLAAVFQLKVPAVGESITEVEISPDYHYAKVFVSVLGSEEEHASTLTALSTAASFIRRELRTRLKSLRHR